MKKLLVVLGILALSFTGSAFAYTVNDPVNDQLGVREFDIYGINASTAGGNLLFDIYTNYPQAGVVVGGWSTFSGDLALSTNGINWNYGIALTNHDGLTAGNLYSNAQWYISDDYEPLGGGYGYNHNKIVTLKPNSDVAGVGQVNWLQQVPGSPDWDINVLIPNVVLNGYIPDANHTYMASASCANDFTAPEPVSTVLFLTGGSVMLVRRLRKAKK